MKNSSTTDEGKRPTGKPNGKEDQELSRRKHQPQAQCRHQPIQVKVHREPKGICATQEGMEVMPFKSKAQQRFMYAKHPKIAKKWAKKTSSFKSLPARAKKRK